MKPIPCDRCRVSLERVSVPKHHSRPHLIFETSGQGIQARPKQYVSVPDNRSVVPRLRSAAAQPGLIDSEPNRWDESHESTCLDMNQQTQSHTHSGAHTSESIARTLFAVILLMPPATGVSITIDSREKKKKKTVSNDLIWSNQQLFYHPPSNKLACGDNVSVLSRDTSRVSLFCDGPPPLNALVQLVFAGNPSI